MNFQVGDKVKFLNEEGGGVVSKIITHSLVNVMIEDGFEIPTATSNLLKINLDGAAGRFFYKETNVPFIEGVSDTMENSHHAIERISSLIKQAGKKQTPLGIYLGFIPQDQKWMITGLLDIYILNNTDTDISYNYFLAENDGSHAGMDTDSIPAFSKIYLQTISREEIKDWNQGIIQVLFFAESMKKVLLPASCSFTVRESKFLKEENYISTSILNERAILSTVVELSKQGKVSSRETMSPKDDTEIPVLVTKEFKETDFIEKHKIATGEAEVDLHIEELVESEAGLSAEQILKIQLDYFVKCLDSALANHYHRLIFIHGVGNGTLKMALRQILDTYKGLQHHIAPMAKYGVGAIEVKVFHNR